jgi:hypothetical protein
MKENNSQSPFRFAKHIQHGIPLTAEEMKEFSPFLMNKLYYYAGRIQFANLLNILWILPKAFQYRLYCIFFKGLRPYGWIKSTKQKEPNCLEIDYLKKVYQVSSKVAKEYAQLLSTAERKEIKTKFE